MDLLKDYINLRILFEILPENGLATSSCHLWFQLTIRAVRCQNRGFKGGTVGIKLWRIAWRSIRQQMRYTQRPWQHHSRVGGQTSLPWQRRGGGWSLEWLRLKARHGCCRWDIGLLYDLPLDPRFKGQSIDPNYPIWGGVKFCSAPNLPKMSCKIELNHVILMMILPCQ